MNIVFIIKELLKAKSMQEFINERFLDTNRLIIPQRKDINGKYDYSKYMKIVSYDGKTFFYWDELIDTISSIHHEYKFDDIRKSDVVLDIGGCVGAYALQICHDVKQVYVVEPLLDERIKRNIDLTNQLNNSIHNVKIFKCALGSGNENINISFQGGNVNVPSYTLTELKEMCGGHIDVLKVDCEGGEWSIQQHELIDIRRIEMEVHTGDSFEYHGGISRTSNVTKIHYTDKTKRFMDFVNMLKSVGFECTYTILDEHTGLVHGFKK